jgi:hypothetical protein
MYKMSQSDFDYWARIFAENFPVHPMLKRLYKSWRPEPVLWNSPIKWFVSVVSKRR